LDRDPAIFGSSEFKRLKEISETICVPVPRHFVSSSEIFLAELIKWNRRMNLISRGDEQRVIERHLLDSLCLLSVERNLSGKRLLDVGSGAGFPGVVLAMWEPNVEMFLVESRSKRIAFLKAVRRLLGLDNLVVLHSRIERLSEVKGVSQPFDILVSRGVGGAPALASSLGDTLSEDGLFVLYKGLGAADELKQSNEGALLNKLGYEIEIVKPAWQHLTVLLVLRKTSSN
jgi:16S rRNA (guanine527-N7)-methyltransferase